MYLYKKFRMNILSINDIPYKNLLKENRINNINEKRKNPEVNKKLPPKNRLEKEIINAQTYGDNIFISFRNSQNTTLINPNNKFDTPTGIYTYPYNGYADKLIHQNEELSNSFPFTGNDEPKFIYIYVLRNFNGIITNNDTNNELRKYYEKLINNNNVSTQIKNIVRRYIDNGLIDNDLINDFKSTIHNDWYFKDSSASILWGILINSNDNMGKVSSIARDIGINGFIDMGEGFIHSNEDYQAVFFRSRGIFSHVDSVSIDKTENPSDIITIKNVHDIRRLSKEKLKKFLVEKVISKISDKVYSYRGSLDKVLLFTNKLSPIGEFINSDSKFINGFLRVKYLNYEYGFLDSEGKVFPKDGKTFEFVYNFTDDGFANITFDGNKWEYIDNEGNFYDEHKNRIRIN